MADESKTFHRPQMKDGFPMWETSGFHKKWIWLFFLNVLLFYKRHTNIFKSDIMTARVMTTALLAKLTTIHNLTQTHDWNIIY